MKKKLNKIAKDTNLSDLSKYKSKTKKNRFNQSDEIWVIYQVGKK